MIPLAQMAVVFVGIAGDTPAHGKAVDRQLAPALARAHVETVALSDEAIRTLVHHRDGSADIVTKLHADGVIGGELVPQDGGKYALRVVIYHGDGRLDSLGETPLDKPALARDDLAAFASNLENLPVSTTPVAPVSPTPVAPVVEPPPPARVARTARPAEPADGADDESPLDKAPLPKHLAATTAPPRTAPPADDADGTPAKPVDTADAVSLDDLDAMTGGGGAPAAAEGVRDSALDTLHLHAGVGLGLAGRAFSAGPRAIANYSGNAVGVVHFEANACPTERVVIAVAAERTLSMSTQEADGMADTTMSRFDATAAYAITTGTFVFAPMLGVGRRAFSIDSVDPARSPDTEYRYVTLGATAKATLGQRVALTASAALQPVFGGTEMTDMAFGDATRWAVDAGAALEVKPIDHVFARLSVDYQRFSWTWDVGARGAGGAVDSYPTGMLAVGGDY